MRHDPSSAPAHCNLGTLLFALDCNAEALAALRHALALDPGYALAHGNLGALLARSGCPVAAESASRTAIALAPDQHRWLTNLGVALFSQGRHAEAEDCYRKALTMQPDYASGHGNLLFALNYRPDAHRGSDLCRIPGLGPPPREAARDRTSRHSRWIGHQGGDCGSVTYRRISGSMQWRCSPNRCSPRMIGRTSNSISMRASLAEDAATERFRSLGDHWRSTIGLCDAKLAELIRATGSMFWSIWRATVPATGC